MVIVWSLTGALSVALASEVSSGATPSLDPPGGEASLERFVPLRSQYEERWTRIDLRAQDLHQSGNWLIVTGLAAGAVGGTLLALEQDIGALPLALGVGGVLVGPPLALSGAMRAAHALGERGVRISTLPGALGWTSYGLIVLSPAAGEGAWVVAPALYLGAVGLAALQARQNRRGRTYAGLPQSVTLRLAPGPGGLALVSSF